MLSSYIVTKALQLITTRNYSVFEDMARDIYHGTFNAQYNYSSYRPDPNERVIYVANYPNDPLEYFTFGLFPNIIVMARDTSQVRFKCGMLSGIIFQKGKYIPIDLNGNNHERVRDQIKEHIKTKSIFTYPEIIYKRKDIYELCPFRTGIFKIAHELNIPIVPLVIDHIKYRYGGFIENRFRIHVGSKRYMSSNIEDDIESIRGWMLPKLESLR